MEQLHPKQAFEILQASPNTLLIDCRTEAEFYYVGHPVVRCCPFVPYLPYNPCHPVVRCRLCAPGYQLGLYPPFVPAFPVVPVVRAALARHLVRTVQAVPALPVLLAVALSGNRRIAT